MLLVVLFTHMEKKKKKKKNAPTSKGDRNVCTIMRLERKRDQHTHKKKRNARAVEFLRTSRP